MKEMVIVSKKCVFCHKIHEVKVPDAEYANWAFCGTPIQYAMPNVPAEDREFLISGICPICWEDTFVPEDGDGVF